MASRRYPFRLVAGLLVGLWAGVTTSGQPDPKPIPASTPPAPLPARHPLVVGVTSDSYPYGFTDEQGKPTGFSNDLFDAVARVLRLEIRRVSLPGRELHERFREGQFDLLQAFSQTVDRDSYADFSVPYLTLQGAIFIQKDQNLIHRLEDLNGRKFAIVGARSIGEKFLRDQGLRVEPVVVSSSEEALRLVDRGEVAGTFISQLTALSVMERRQIRNVVIFDQPLSDYDIRHCYAVHKGDAVLLARLNEGLAILHRTGEFDEIYRRWFGRLDAPLITRQRAIQYGVGLLAIGFVVTVTAYLRLRTLHRRIAAQAAELAGQQAHLRALYDNIPLAMCVLEEGPEDPHRFLTLNRHAEILLGLAPGTGSGRQLGELPVEGELAEHLNAFLQSGRGRTTLLREERLLPRARRHLTLLLVPLERSAEGRPRFCLLAEDTTERHFLDEEVAQSRKLRAVGELVGGIAHEFNNLLTPIFLQTGQIQLDRPNDPDLSNSVGLIAKTAQRAAELTRRLLTFGRKSESRPEVVQLAAAVDGCFALLRLTVDRRIQWHNEIPAQLPALYLNATDLNQILVNLLLNARDTLQDKLATQGATGWAPIIRVTAESLPPSTRILAPAARTAPPRGWIRLTVSDNGMGMEPEVRERIYEPFFTTKAVGQGTGLGLATVWHLVQVTGGRIEVESLPGQGTDFKVILPILPLPAPAPAAVPVETARSVVQARIFLAEDDDLVAQTVIATLRRDGHEIHREPDGAAAWQTLEARPDDFDLLVLDVNMPGLSGIEVVQRLRAAGRYRGPILVMSGRLGSEELETLTGAKVDCVLGKPFEMADFLGSVRRCLASVPRG
jgi:two-component system cell cycle sensor histidine kinase/response regulator CckA